MTDAFLDQLGLIEDKIAAGDVKAALKLIDNFLHKIDWIIDCTVQVKVRGLFQDMPAWAISVMRP
jgi:hypothetical protein